MSTVAKKVIMGSGAVGEFEIDQSLILDHASAPILYKEIETTGNRKTFTFSCWVKSAKNITAQESLITVGNALGTGYVNLTLYEGSLRMLLVANNAQSGQLFSTPKFRDYSAWYHIVLAVDTTQGTASNRVKLYVNGVRLTAFDTENYPSQNLDTSFSVDGYYTVVGQDVYWLTDGAARGFNGNIAEAHILDGVAKAPSDFGETNEDTGQWVPKEYEGGSYGTNGFYGKFVSGAIGTDSSGQGNTMTVANLANSDVVIDTPNNNFATLNPLYTGSVSNTFSEGNLKIVTPSTGYGTSTATIVPTSGKYYAEFKGTTSGGAGNYGVRDVSMAATNSTWLPDGSTKNMAYQGSNGNIYYNGSSVLSSAPATFTTNDVIAVAIDYDNSTVKWYKNNSLQYTATSADLENVTFAGGDSGNSTAVTAEANFGQKTLAYTPPSGYVALSTANLPDPAIPLPSAHFNTVLYAGSGSAQTISGVGFQPDFSWTKCRSAATWHRLVDAVRGSNKEYFSNDAYQEVNSAGGARAMTFESDGFAWGGDSGDVNGSGRNYVSWNWKANGTGSTDTSGDIDATVSANPTSGFSIVKYTATSDPDATVPHGLGVAPEMVFYKWGSSAWYCWTTVIDGSNDRLVLDRDDAKTTVSATYGSFTSSFIRGIDVSTGVIAYCFASIPNFSKIGVYTGNNNADGPMILTGFKPAWVMVKRTDGANEWIIVDVKRDIDNVASHRLFPNLADAESTSQSPMDILSNGFKLRTSAGICNAAGTYFYMAFAEAPFKYANAR